MGSGVAGVSILTPLQTYAVISHELYTELVEAGFREEQAVVIVIGLSQKE